MDITDKVKMDSYESSHNDFSMTWKSYQILREGRKASNGEIDELISYFTLKEEFEICDQLNKL